MSEHRHDLLGRHLRRRNGARAHVRRRHHLRAPTDVSGSASPDAYNYRIDSYILYKTQSSGRQLKQITVVVRDGQAPTKTLARLTSTFDQTVSS